MEINVFINICKLWFLSKDCNSNKYECAAVTQKLLHKYLLPSNVK